MSEFSWALVGAAYALVGVRCGIVHWRIEKRIGRLDRVFTFFVFLTWPLIMLMVGVGIVISGDCGIHDPTYSDKAALPDKDAP